MEISNAHITLAAASAVDVAAAASTSASVSLATLTHFHDTQMSKIIAVKYANEVKILPPSPFPAFYCRQNRKVSKRKVRSKKRKQLEPELQKIAASRRGNRAFCSTRHSVREIVN